MISTASEDIESMNGIGTANYIIIMMLAYNI